MTNGLHGQVIGTDGPFGNLVLNVPAETFAQLGYKLGDQVPVTLDGKQLRLSLCEDIQRCAGGQGAFLHRLARTALASASTSATFAETYKVGEGAELTIPKKCKRSVKPRRVVEDARGE